MFKTLFLAVIGALFLVSPAISQQSLPSIHKRVGATFPRNAVTETSVFVFNGRLLLISFQRPRIATSPPNGIRVSDYATGAKIATWAWPAAYGNVIVTAGQIHIFGSQGEVAGNNAIVHSTLDPDTFAPSAPQTIWTSAGPEIQNVGITYNPDANVFVLVAQTAFVNGAAGTFFLQSATINGPWSQTGGSPSLQFGAWKIYYVGGAYYIPWQAGASGIYWGQWARSTDLVTWTISPTIWVYPDYPNEGASNGDTTCAELGGITYCSYDDGDQSTWGDIKTFIYPNTFANLLGQFFPEGPPIKTIFSSLASVTSGVPAGWSIRSICVTGGGQAATQIRVTIRAGSIGPYPLNHLSVGTWNGVAANTTATPVDLTFSGAASVTVAANTEVTSDWVNFATAQGATLVVSQDIANASGQLSDVQAMLGGANGRYYYSLSGTHDLSSPANPVGHDGVTDAVMAIEVR